MEIHVPTLALVAVFVAAILGVLLILAGRRDQSTPALLWWGGGYIFVAASFALLSARSHIPDVLSIEIANAFLLTGYGMVFAGVRAFCGRDTPITMLLIAPLVWLTAMRVPSIAGDVQQRVVVVTIMQTIFVTLTAYELWRERAEPLLSRWPTIFVLLTHATILGVRMVAISVTPAVSPADLFRASPAFAMLALGTLLYTITFAFLLLSMSKERSELRHKIAATIDPLTGLANRRAFMSEADAMIVGRASRSAPLAVLLADLDRFKAINDMHGHAVGDRVLVIFARTLMRTIGPDDLAGRIGGEEFAIVQSQGSDVDALALAENIRVAFAEAAAEIGGRGVGATVSIGVASSRIGVHDLSGLLAQADRALYRSKESGRNRVMAFDPAAEIDEAPLVPTAARSLGNPVFTIPG